MGLISILIILTEKSLKLKKTENTLLDRAKTSLLLAKDKSNGSCQTLKGIRL
jgi:hypothetical protein